MLLELNNMPPTPSICIYGASAYKSAFHGSVRVEVLTALDDTTGCSTGTIFVTRNVKVKVGNLIFCFLSATLTIQPSLVKPLRELHLVKPCGKSKEREKKQQL